ncbi:MAG: translation initiation factor IF-2 N-terminal domain-containing protein, partial [Muribaculaceae bacterium]|nr:translation initiation factor IF-2 N-terminal domain-containing protein [Muribaculaceae bacterium]
MAKQKISNLAKELNVGLPNIFEFLRKNNIDVPESPNTRVEESVAEMLTHHFQP